MATVIREELHQQIDAMPDDVVELISDFALFVMARRQNAPTFTEWGKEEWQDFTLEQLFREDDPVAYSLSDAQEVYHP